MRKIAITGTIGSGKSECSKIITTYGYSVFNCDDEVHKMYQPEHIAYSKICEKFPGCVHDGIINKKEIADVVFSNDLMKKQLEELIYSYLLPKLLTAMETSTETYFFAEVPLLFEIGWEKYFDECFVVEVSDTIAIDRLIRFRNMSREDALRRLMNQKRYPINKEIKCTIFNNNGTEKELENQIQTWFRKEENTRCN